MCKHGYGTNIFSNGDEYMGDWKNDKYHGKGTITYTDGTVKAGIWENGLLLDEK
jgi:hypothetical protein